MHRLQPQLAVRTTALLKKRGLSLRAAALKTGIDRLTMSKLAGGVPPRIELIEQFARAFNEDVNEWRALAGYPCVESGLPRVTAESRPHPAVGEMDRQEILRDAAVLALDGVGAIRDGRIAEAIRNLSIVITGLSQVMLNDQDP
ncbi:MAG TPA: helix-turn-helix transcriptional regulator, partial [Armatimonadota bacterium]|nr:helix-turn-helix transcriptional regulator [Armatimonadota bacterium]